MSLNPRGGGKRAVSLMGRTAGREAGGKEHHEFGLGLDTSEMTVRQQGAHRDSGRRHTRRP